ncbi:hypothetical protein KSP40_PGU014121 [Platanthera guangdongensis]|uniref:Ribosomal protein L2 n=1 Tax=Platanthera guangdongensis TaxID=2320717 RepID=A0ABR2LSY5_9ASPA
MPLKPKGSSARFVHRGWLKEKKISCASAPRGRSVGSTGAVRWVLKNGLCLFSFDFFIIINHKRYI